MDVNDYRKAYEAELAANAAAGAARVAGPTLGAVAEDAHRGQASDKPSGSSPRTDLSEKIPRLLAILRDAAQPVAARIAALKAISAARFLGGPFAPYRVDFLNTLRQIAQPGIDAALCESALAILAVEKDPDTQQRLRSGLQAPQSALVSPATALQLLSYDDHANLADLALDIFHKAVDLGTKEAALRVLATDAKSQDLFTKLLQDKSQPRSLRALSATGLNFLNPQKFAEVARNIVEDHSDFEDIRASALGALANTPLHHLVRDNADFLNEIKTLGAQSPLTNLRAAAGRFLGRS
jgi:hypothetical protein